MLLNRPEILLRAAQPEDEAFLREVYSSGRREELDQVPWDDEQKDAFLVQQFNAQARHYAEHYSGASFDLIIVDGQRAGRLYVDRWTGELRIVDITLLPEFRRKGIGTHLVRRLLDEAAGDSQRVSIHVEKFNPAIPLYERLGFRAVQDQGVYLLMEWHTGSGELYPKTAS